MDFVHLHTHSHYSLLDAVPHIKDLVQAAKSRGFTALALTDHANMYGAIEFYEACEKEGIKSIIGVEMYVTPYALADPQITEHKEYHLVLLAENYQGYRNMMKLVSLANVEGLRDRPLVDAAWLQTYHEGIIALSGCLEGEIPSLLRKENNYEKAKKRALFYRDLFGVANFFLELNDLPDLSGQMDVNTQLIRLAEETGIPLVVTRDAHYLNPRDDEAQDIMTCIGSGQTIDEPNRPTMVGVDYSLATAKEIIGRFKHVPAAIENTVKIAERVTVKLELNRWYFPVIDIPDGKTADTYLRELVYEKLPSLTEITDIVRERVEYELDIITKKGYSPYFLVVADYVNYARTHQIVETTRGSGAGSIVSYAMGITSVNPLHFKLPFERFLNPFRPSPPDIDADFADDRRDEMIAYVTSKYGADKVAQIVTFGTMMARAAIRDVGRALGYSYSVGDQVAKLIPFGAQGFHITIDKALELEAELKELYNKNAQVKRLIDLARTIEGCARHTSIHAAGVVIAPTPLTDFTPVQLERGGTKTVTQYEMHAVEAAGLLKMDFLGIRNLSILGHAVEIVEKTTGQKIDIHHLEPWDDKKTYDMLARGETVGVFQMASSGMTRYLKELKPTTIFDIMAMVALFRPGPMDSIPDYIRRKHHAELVEYLDPRMRDYLDQSLGLIVYQDDVLLTAINLAGYNWEEADKFRKAMGKKIPAEMMKQKQKFYQGCKTHGKLNETTINKLWERIEPFAAYGFNKSHAASYGVVAYQTAYLKANFPIQYMTAVLIAESGDIDKVPGIIHECGRMGIKVLPPEVNESFKNFAMVQVGQAGEKAHIRFGLNGIKNLGQHIADVIYRERREQGSYISIEDFLQRVNDKDLNKKSLESLIKCGAMDSFGFDRGVLLANIENLLSFVHAQQENQTSKQGSLFASSPMDKQTKVQLKPATPATLEEKMKWEKELLGLYVTAHPFAPYQKILEPALTPINELSAQARHQWVVVGGVIENTKKKITRSGGAMMFVTLQDVTGSLELLVFPKTFETTKDVWVVGQLACVIGRTSDEEDDKLFVEKAYTITQQNVSRLLSQLAVTKNSALLKIDPKNSMVTTSMTVSDQGKVLRTPSNSIEINITTALMKLQSESIKAIFKKYPGDKTVYLNVDGKKIKTAYMVSGNEVEEEIATLKGE